MADIAELGLIGVAPLVDNYDRAWDPIKTRAQRMRERRRNRRQPESNNKDGDRSRPEDGWVLKKRSEVQSDEEIVAKIPHRRQDKPSMARRPSSADGDRYENRYRGRDDRRMTRYRDPNDDYDSEGSIPPRTRVSQGHSKRSSSKSSSSSSDLGSSSEDERLCKHTSRSVWLTSGFAAVATVHAAGKVYSSLENRDKRHKAVMKGEISQEEAKKQRHKARFQDAAALGVAALGIKGAVGEWHEVEEKQEEHKRLRREAEERHRRREERQRRLMEENRYGRGSRDDLPDRPKAIKQYGEDDRRRSKSMSNQDVDRRPRELVRSQSRWRSDE